jgi:hypothetical protein
MTASSNQKSDYDVEAWLNTCSYVISTRARMQVTERPKFPSPIGEAT